MANYPHRSSQSAPDFEKFKSSYTSTGAVYAIDSDVDVLQIDPDEQIREIADDDNVHEANECLETGVWNDDNGVLDVDMVTTGLCWLNLSADGEGLSYIQLTLIGYHLTDISILSDQTQLQKIELPWNDLTDLSPLCNLTHVVHLDVSHNKLTSLLDFSPPKNLKIVDFSFNEVTEITNLCHNPFIFKLYLNNNSITELKGFSYCKQLSTLDLAHNNIKEIRGLQGLPIQHLNLNGNKLTAIEGLHDLKFLKIISLSGNKIRSLAGLEGHRYLCLIDLEDNEVIDLNELRYIRDTNLLRNLNLLRNPIQELPDYWLSVLHHIPQLTVLDMCKVDVTEKVAGSNTFAPTEEVISSCDHILNTVFQFFQPTYIRESTLASTDTPYPMLVLAGPCGSGKKYLSMKLAQDFPEYFSYGISHTTRRPLPDETDGKDYHFVNREQFAYDVKMGRFIQTCDLNNCVYGLQMDSIEKIAKQGLATIAHMELEGVLGMKKTYLEPRYILVLPSTKQSHEKRLLCKGKHNHQSVSHQVKRAEMYATYNQSHPGFFDIVINNQSVGEAYERLRLLIMEYLGLSRTVNLPTTTDMLSESELDSRPVSQTKPSTPKTNIGIIEQVSIKKRESDAHSVVSGQKQPLYDRLTVRRPRAQSVTHVNISEDISQEESLDRCSSDPLASPAMRINASVTDQLNEEDREIFPNEITLVVDRPGSNKHPIVPPIGISYA